jgi:hypothetical protein
MRKSSLTFAVVAVSWAGAGAALAQQPMAGDYQLQQPMAGSYQLQQPMAGSYQLQQPLVGSYQLQQPLAGQEALQRPYGGVHEPRWPSLGGYFLGPSAPGNNPLQWWSLEEGNADDRAR